MYVNTANSTCFEQNKNIFNFLEHFQLRWERQNFLCVQFPAHTIIYFICFQTSYDILSHLTRVVTYKDLQILVLNKKKCLHSYLAWDTLYPLIYYFIISSYDLWFVGQTPQQSEVSAIYKNWKRFTAHIICHTGLFARCKYRGLCCYECYWALGK